MTCSSAPPAATATSTSAGSDASASATAIEQPDIWVWPTEMSIAEYDVAARRVNLWKWRKPIVRWYLTPREWAILGASGWEAAMLHAVCRIVSHEFIHALICELEGYGATMDYDNILDFDMQEAMG